jgi:hypothetical protein
MLAWKEASPVGPRKHRPAGFFSHSDLTKELSTLAEGVLKMRWYSFFGVHF